VTAAGDAVLIQGTVQEISAGTAIVVTGSGALVAVPVTDLEEPLAVPVAGSVTLAGLLEDAMEDVQATIGNGSLVAGTDVAEMIAELLGPRVTVRSDQQ
jgi:hypothetical protein